MEDFIYYDFEGGRGRKLKKDTVRLHNKKGNKSLVINAELSSYIKTAGFDKLRIREDSYTGEIALIFNKDKGRPYSQSTERDQNCVVFNSIDIVELLIEKLKLGNNEAGCYNLPVNSLRTTEEYAIFAIKSPINNL